MKRLLYVGIVMLLTATGAINAAASADTRRVGVLLVNHGSRSATWRDALMALEDRVRPQLLARAAIGGVKTAFMEYNEPSIATRMKEFDAEGFTDVVIVPIFLTVSPHTFDDIPTILGMKTDAQSLEALKIEKIERYTPKARTVLTPNLDFPDILRLNVLRRVRSLSRAPAEEGLVLIAYGDETYEKEWSALLQSVGRHVMAETGMDRMSHGWCGHIAHYDPDRTTDAITEVLRTEERAIVVPVLVAVDEYFQIKIIGDGIREVPDHQARVIYRPDSILPDPDVEAWVIRVAAEYAEGLRAGVAAVPGSER